jgi:hypothetical protein
MLGLDGLLEIVARLFFNLGLSFGLDLVYELCCFINDELVLFYFESLSLLEFLPFKGFFFFSSVCWTSEPRLVLWNMLELLTETWFFLWMFISLFGLWFVETTHRSSALAALGAADLIPAGVTPKETFCY